MPGYPTAGGFPNKSGGYIPLLYATMMLIEFYKATVFGAIATTEYEGQLKQFGDTLRIRTLPDIVSRKYVKGQKLIRQRPDPGFLDLVIDKGEYWSVSTNNLDTKQIDLPYIQKWAEHASITQKVAIDSDVLSNVYAYAHANNCGSTAGANSGAFDMGEAGAPVELSKSTILDWIVDAGTVLDEQNVPDENRWFTLPSWACGMLKKSDLKDASLTGDGKSTLRNGRIGMIDRFEIFRSNNLATTVDDSTNVTNAMFGHKSAIAFASQMTEQRTIDDPDDFGKITEALQAYGYKVVKPEALGHGYIAKG